MQLSSKTALLLVGVVAVVARDAGGEPPAASRPRAPTLGQQAQPPPRRDWRLISILGSQRGESDADELLGAGEAAQALLLRRWQAVTLLCLSACYLIGIGSVQPPLRLASMQIIDDAFSKHGVAAAEAAKAQLEDVGNQAYALGLVLALPLLAALGAKGGLLLALFTSLASCALLCSPFFYRLSANWRVWLVLVGWASVRVSGAVAYPALSPFVRNWFERSAYAKVWGSLLAGARLANLAFAHQNSLALDRCLRECALPAETDGGSIAPLADVLRASRRMCWRRLLAVESAQLAATLALALTLLRDSPYRVARLAAFAPQLARERAAVGVRGASAAAAAAALGLAARAAAGVGRGVGLAIVTGIRAPRAIVAAVTSAPAAVVAVVAAASMSGGQGGSAGMTSGLDGEMAGGASSRQLQPQWESGGSSGSGGGGSDSPPVSGANATAGASAQAKAPLGAGEVVGSALAALPPPPLHLAAQEEPALGGGGESPVDSGGSGGGGGGSGSGTGGGGRVVVESSGRRQGGSKARFSLLPALLRGRGWRGARAGTSTASLLRKCLRRKHFWLMAGCVAAYTPVVLFSVYAGQYIDHIDAQTPAAARALQDAVESARRAAAESSAQQPGWRTKMLRALLRPLGQALGVGKGRRTGRERPRTNPVANPIPAGPYRPRPPGLTTFAIGGSGHLAYQLSYALGLLLGAALYDQISQLQKASLNGVLLLINALCFAALAAFERGGRGAIGEKDMAVRTALLGLAGATMAIPSSLPFAMFCMDFGKEGSALVASLLQAVGGLSASAFFAALPRLQRARGWLGVHCYLAAHSVAVMCCMGALMVDDARKFREGYRIAPSLVNQSFTAPAGRVALARMPRGGMPPLSRKAYGTGRLLIAHKLEGGWMEGWPVGKEWFGKASGFTRVYFAQLRKTLPLELRPARYGPHDLWLLTNVTALPPPPPPAAEQMARGGPDEAAEPAGVTAGSDSDKAGVPPSPVGAGG